MKNPYKSRGTQLLTGLPLAVLVVVVALKLQGRIDWTWLWVGAAALGLMVIWFVLDQAFVDRG